MSFEISQNFTVNYQYPVVFTDDVFNPENNVLRKTLELAGPHRHKILVIADTGVLSNHPTLTANIHNYFSHHKDIMRQMGNVFPLPGGETAKQGFHFINQIYQLIADEGICRHSFVLVIGGGAVIDAVGYAAATAHRGVRLIRMPTTVLAQNDAALGVKNAINHNNRKNFIGTFSTPWAVIGDYQFLSTLDPNNKRAGMAEAIKIALIKDKSFFEFLYQQRNALARFENNPVQELISQCARLHLKHIATNGDPFENGSARPLDYGHWLAHKLEEISQNKISHGEAVAIGIAVDSHYSYQMGCISEDEFSLIFNLLNALGFELNKPQLKEITIVDALDEFRQHLGGVLTLTLLKGIGQGHEVNHIDHALMQQSINYISHV